MAYKLFWLAFAGASGTLARYGLSGLVHRFDGVSFPVGTLAVNITGCLIAGFAWVSVEQHWVVSAETRAIIFIGFLGAFTTFSSYILETTNFIVSSEWLYAAGNILLQNVLGFAAFFIGLALGRWLL